MVAFEHLLAKRKKAENHLAASAMYPHMYPSRNNQDKKSIITDG